MESIITASSTHTCGANNSKISTPQTVDRRLHLQSTPKTHSSRGEEIPNENFSREDISVKRKRLSMAGDTEDESDSDQNILSVVWCGGNLGASYYESSTGILHLFLEVLESHDFSVLRKIIVDIQPSNIVMSAKQDDRVIKFIQKLIGLDETSESSVNQTISTCIDVDTNVEVSNCTLDFLPSIDFAYEISKQRIITLSLPNIPKDSTEAEKILHMSSRIPFECSCTVKSIGGLLKYLDKKRIHVELENEDISAPILDLNVISLKHLVGIDQATYSALQIFQKQCHPAAGKMGTGSKDGLSLFGILNRTRSRCGHLMMKQWFNQPLRDIVELKRRLDAVEYFSNSANHDIVTRLQNTLKCSRNLPKTIKRMKTGQISMFEWRGLYTTLSNAVTLADICRCASKASTMKLDLFHDILNTFTEDVAVVAECIYKIMDVEESISQNQFIVKPGIDKTLDEKKHMFNGLPSYLYEVAEKEAQHYEEITQCHVMYMRRVGYLLAVKIYPGLEDEEDLPAGLTMRLKSKDYIYCKSERTIELDNNLGDILDEISDLEITIMHQLQNTILEHRHVLFKASALMAELDCLLSFAAVSRDLDYVRPVLTNSNIIQVKKGRHPLQELVVPLFVPNDIFLGDENGRVILLTGPNACGKSVYLKQVGLIAFMAHIGCFVPAQSATIGLFDRIFTRIRTIESISLGMSTFAIDLHQMSFALNNATDRSLVLVDEFGKGTATVDGVSLLAASIKYWLNMSKKCPFIICSTHFHCLLQQKLLPQTDIIQYYTLKTVRNTQNDEMVFLHELKKGIADCSYAAYIALMAGLMKELVMRGNEVSTLIQNNTPIRRFDTSSSRTYTRKCADLSRKFVSFDLSNYEKTSKFLADIRQQLEENTKRTTEESSLHSPEITSNLSHSTSKNII